MASFLPDALQANAALYPAIDAVPLVGDGDPLGVEGFASHHLPLAQAPEAYETFQRKEDGFVKVVLQP